MQITNLWWQGCQLIAIERQVAKLGELADLWRQTGEPVIV
jgi:hypothetical protein